MSAGNNKHSAVEIMSEKNTDIAWDEIDMTSPTDHRFITDISETLSNLSAGKRAERRRQKLRAELVREHIENRNRAPGLLQGLVNRFTR